jgi:hypothetical protein
VTDRPSLTRAPVPGPACLDSSLFVLGQCSEKKKLDSFMLGDIF